MTLDLFVPREGLAAMPHPTPTKLSCTDNFSYGKSCRAVASVTVVDFQRCCADLGVSYEGVSLVHDPLKAWKVSHP